MDQRSILQKEMYTYNKQAHEKMLKVICHKENVNENQNEIHYFESKLGAYEFIYEYSVRYMVLELSTMVSKSETNLIEVMKQTEFARMHAMREYPYMQQFLNRAMSEDVGEALLATEETRAILEKEYNRIRSQIHFTGFPSGVDGKKLYKMMDYTIKGLLTERFMENSFQPEMFYEEVTEYLDMMKHLVAR